MMLNLSNHLTILKAWLLLKACHCKRAGLQLSQGSGLFSDVLATFMRPSQYIKLGGWVTVLLIFLLIWWICLYHGVLQYAWQVYTDIYEVKIRVWFVWKWWIGVCLLIPIVYQLGNEGLRGNMNSGKVGICQVNLMLGGFRDFISDTGEGKW